MSTPHMTNAEWYAESAVRVREAIALLEEARESLNTQTHPCECCGLQVFDARDQLIMSNTLGRSVSHLTDQLEKLR